MILEGALTVNANYKQDYPLVQSLCYKLDMYRYFPKGQLIQYLNCLGITMFLFQLDWFLKHLPPG